METVDCEIGIDPSITRIKLENTYWPKILPIRVPLDSTIEKYTKGRNGRITCWFNASSATWRGQNYIAVRCASYPFWANGRIALGRLDENFRPIGPAAEWLTLPGRNGFGDAEDPRLFIHRDRLFVDYTDGSRIRIAWLDDECRVENSCMLRPVNFSLNKVEKNWMFISHDDELFCIYAPDPHTVLKVNRCEVEKFHVEPWEFPWEWGTPRGGATPVYHKGHYWHFFHSVSDYNTNEPDIPWPGLRRYHTGLVIYAGEPPFSPVAATSSPVISAVDIPARDEVGITLPSQHAAIYPGSAHRNKEDDGWLLTCGYNDQEVHIYGVPDELIESKLA